VSVGANGPRPLRELRFGHFLVPNAADPLLETARRVEDLGLDYVGIQDHPYEGRDAVELPGVAAVGPNRTRARITVRRSPCGVMSRRTARVPRCSSAFGRGTSRSGGEAPSEHPRRERTLA
jgi:hypothetical protein